MSVSQRGSRTQRTLEFWPGAARQVPRARGARSCTCLLPWLTSTRHEPRRMLRSAAFSPRRRARAAWPRPRRSRRCWSQTIPAAPRSYDLSSTRRVWRDSAGAAREAASRERARGVLPTPSPARALISPAVRRPEDVPADLRGFRARDGAPRRRGGTRGLFGRAAGRSRRRALGGAQPARRPHGERRARGRAAERRRASTARRIRRQSRDQHWARARRARAREGGGNTAGGAGPAPPRARRRGRRAR